MWPLLPVFSEQADRGAPLVFLVICNILCERCNRSSPCHTAILIKETALLGEYERNRVSKANKEVQSHDISH